jgi:hypothetical protein
MPPQKTRRWCSRCIIPSLLTQAEGRRREPHQTSRTRWRTTVQEGRAGAEEVVVRRYRGGGEAIPGAAAAGRIANANSQCAYV